MSERTGVTPSKEARAVGGRDLGRVLRARYLPALVVVALLAVAGHLALARVLALQDDGAAAVNVSGRQRMLSQRIALHVVLLRTDTENEQAHRVELMRLIDLMGRSQRALLVGDDDLGLSATDADEVLRLLTGTEGLDERVATFLRDARELATEPDPGTGEAIRRAELLVAEARGPLLEELDAVVGAFQRDAEDDLGLMWRVSVGLMVGTLVTVVMEGLLVFRPLARRLGRTTEELAVADTDVVTGLWTRRRLLLELRSSIEDRSRPTLWVLYCDLDGFKRVNDDHGHDAGDEVLRGFADRLVSVLPEGAIAGRVGGDEFVVALRCEPGEVASVAEDIVSVARRPFPVAGTEVRIGTSVGVAAAGSVDDSADRLLSRADAAMYEAKRDGKGVVQVVGDRPQATGTRRSRLAAELSAATAAGELAVRYRTIVDPDTRTVTGVEAVVAWDAGGLSPNEVLAAAIETGLGSMVTSFAIEEVRRVLPTLAEAVDTPVAVNVTSNDLLDAATVERLRSLTDDADRIGVGLAVDIVDHAMEERDQRYLPVLDAFRERGLSIAAEGFGTGPAALVHLGYLPVDVVKIDHDVVTAALGGEHADVALRGLLEVTRSMGVGVVVDGVVDRDTLDRLAGLGCAGAQGPAVSALMSLDELVDRRALR